MTIRVSLGLDMVPVINEVLIFRIAGMQKVAQLQGETVGEAFVAMLDPQLAPVCADNDTFSHDQEALEEEADEPEGQPMPAMASPQDTVLPIAPLPAVPASPTVVETVEVIPDNEVHGILPSTTNMPQFPVMPRDMPGAIRSDIAEKPLEQDPDPERIPQRSAESSPRPQQEVEAAKPLPSPRPETPPAVASEPQQNPDPPTERADSMPVEVSVHISRETRAEIVHAPVAHSPRTVAPHDMARQIADKLVHSDQNRIEITLTPEELGKVRLLITPGDTPSIAVYAENRETLDLLRRNADLLGKELRDTGFAGASLSFGEDADNSSGRRMAAYGMPHREVRAEVMQDDNSHRPAPVSGRQIDLRI